MMIMFVGNNRKIKGAIGRTNLEKNLVKRVEAGYRSVYVIMISNVARKFQD